MVEGLERRTTDARHEGTLIKLFEDASAQIDRLGTEFASDLRRLDRLRQRLREERCHLAVLGQFKRGKSTLVNALLGEEVLPVAVVPVTSLPTFLHGGEQLEARVQFDNGKAEERFAGASAAALAEFLARFVTETANPHNRLGVRLVEARYPAPVLRQGLALIDTPGIGSTFRHNTEATVNFLPQCDAALFVVSADPPITEVEVDFLKAAHRKLVRMFFIFNKVDYLDDDERRVAVEFLQQVLCEQVGLASPPPVFCASARQGLAARKSQDAAAWQQSGMGAIEYQIVDFLLTEKTDVLQHAISRKLDDILADVQRRLQLIIRSLQMPLAELDKRIGQFERSLIEIDEQRIVAIERLARDEKRAGESVIEHATHLLPESMAYFRGVVEACRQVQGTRWSEESTRDAIAAEIPGYFEHEFGIASELCEQELRAALAPHLRRATELIASVHQLMERLFNLSFDAPQQEIALTKVEHPFWRTHKWAFKFTTIPETWVDRIFPRRLRHARIGRRIMEQVEYLVTRNVGFVQWSMLENLKRSFQDFRDTLDENVELAIHSTRSAIESARRQRSTASATFDAEIARLESAAAGLDTLRKRLALP